MTFEALDKGAVDFVTKPGGEVSMEMSRLKANSSRWSVCRGSRCRRDGQPQRDRQRQRYGTDNRRRFGH